MSGRQVTLQRLLHIFQCDFRQHRQQGADDEVDDGNTLEVRGPLLAARRLRFEGDDACVHEGGPQVTERI